MLHQDLQSIQSQVMSSVLQKFGFNKHFPCAVVFGPKAQVNSCCLLEVETGTRGKTSQCSIGTMDRALHQGWKYYYNLLFQVLMGPISDYQAHTIKERVSSLSRKKLLFSQNFRDISINIEDHIPADNVERNPEEGTHMVQADVLLNFSAASSYRRSNVGISVVW